MMSSRTLCLKFKMRQKATLELTCKKRIARQSALSITQDRAHNKFTKLSLILLLHITNQHSKPSNDILFICPLFNGSKRVIQFLLRDLISHKQEKPLPRKYVVVIWLRTEITFSAMLLHSSTLSWCTQNSVHGASLNNAFMPKSDWRSTKSSVSVVILS